MRRMCTLLMMYLTISTTAFADDRHLQSFDTVYRTVFETHFDPTFSGLGWPGIGDRYRPLVAPVRELSEFTRITNQMLFELNLSHLLTASATELQWYLPTIMAPGDIGATVRLIEGHCVIASVAPGSAAHRAGLRPGVALSAIDDRPIAELIEAAQEYMAPPFNARNRENMITRYLLGQINGVPNTAVRLKWKDGDSQPRSQTLLRTSKGKGTRLVAFLPLYYLQFEHRLLQDNIAYVRFNHFAPPIDRLLATTLETLPPRAGLIIDLRGTPGGYLRSLDTAAGMLIDRPVVFYRLQLRDQTVDRMVTPAARPHQGPVVVIIDALSLSSSEIFAGCLQELGRAIVVGNRSPGYVLTADWAELPNGALLMHTIGRNSTPGGTILENTGVTPDFEVPLDRRTLLQGRDVQIEAAIERLQALLARPGA